MVNKILGKPCKVDKTGRLYLPQEVRDLLGIKKDGEDEVYFKLFNDKIIIGKAKVKYEFIDEIIKLK